MDENTIKLFGSKNSDEWSTPQSFFDEVNKEFNFNLDVASSHSNRKCESYFTKTDDSLNQKWMFVDFIGNEIKKGRVWCNPPYSMVKQFLKKGQEEIKKGNSELIVFLTFANTDTTWFHEYCYNKPNVEIRFVKGRLKFTGHNSEGKLVSNSAMRPSILIIMRRDNG
jgi:phage N-6-adenine-methyltransferase